MCDLLVGILFWLRNANRKLPIMRRDREIRLSYHFRLPHQFKCEDFRVLWHKFALSAFRKRAILINEVYKFFFLFGWRWAAWSHMHNHFEAWKCDLLYYGFALPTLLRLLKAPLILIVELIIKAASLIRTNALPTTNGRVIITPKFMKCYLFTWLRFLAP